MLLQKVMSPINHSPGNIRPRFWIFWGFLGSMHDCRVLKTVLFMSEGHSPHLAFSSFETVVIPVANVPHHTSHFDGSLHICPKSCHSVHIGPLHPEAKKPHQESNGATIRARLAAPANIQLEEQGT